MLVTFRIVEFLLVVRAIVLCFELLFGHIVESTGSAVARREFALLNQMLPEARQMI